MALNAYLYLKGQKQGDIKGSVTQKGREGAIAVIAAQHEIFTPHDAASGLPTGKRMHKPYSVTKELDRSSPLLHQAMADNENITVWKLQFFAPGINGIEKQNYTVELFNASIADIRFVMPNNKHADLMSLNNYEEIEFTYQKIQWTWLEGGLVASDSWEEPNV